MSKNATKKRKRRLVGCYIQQTAQLISKAAKDRFRAWLKIADMHEHVHATQHQSTQPNKGRAMVRGGVNENHKPKRDRLRIKGLHTPSVNAKRIGDYVYVRGITSKQFVEFGLCEVTPHSEGHFTYDKSKNCCVFFLETWRELSRDTQLAKVY